MTEKGGMERGSMDGGRKPGVAAELTLLRQGLEALHERVDEIKVPPDPGARIGELARNVTALSERVERVEASEALKSSPRAHAEMMDKAAARVAAQGRKNVQEARERLSSATYEMQLAARHARHPYKQDVRNRWFAAGGVVVSAVLWFVMTAYVFDPAHSIWTYRMMNKDTLWDVGWDFLERHNSKSYDRVLKGFVIYKLNADAFAECEASAKTFGKKVRCTIDVPVPK